MTRTARRCPAPRTRGFSLVEVMISLGVLGIGATALAGLFTSTASGVRKSRNNTAAAQIAVQRLELLAGQGIDRLPSCAGTPSCRATMSTFAPAMPDDGAYRCSQVVAGMDLDDPTTNAADGRYRVDTVVLPVTDGRQRDGARIVRVNVCWTDGRNVHVAQAERLLIPGV